MEACRKNKIKRIIRRRRGGSAGSGAISYFFLQSEFVITRLLGFFFSSFTGKGLCFKAVLFRCPGIKYLSASELRIQENQLKHVRNPTLNFHHISTDIP